MSADELAVGVAALTRGYARNFETSDQIARAVAQLALYDLPDDYYSQFVPRVESLTPEEVMRAAARHLDPARLTTLVVGDVAAVRSGILAASIWAHPSSSLLIASSRPDRDSSIFAGTPRLANRAGGLRTS